MLLALLLFLSTTSLCGDQASGLDAVRSLIAGDRPASMEGIYVFLRDPAPERDAGPGYDALKDAALIGLMALDPPPPDLGTALCGIVLDSSAERVGRIYSAQYLSMLYPMVVKGGDDKSAALILETLYKALDDPCPWLAGTALLQLGELCRNDPGVDRERVMKGILTLSRHDGTAARIAALQVAALLDEPHVLGAARDYAAACSPAPLRAAAINALGVLGDSSDLDNIERMLREPGSQPLAPALRAAARKLEERIKETPEEVFSNPDENR